MQLSTVTAILSAASTAIAAFGLWAFYDSSSPVPSELHTVTGIASNVRTSAILYSKSHATFHLTQANGKSAEYSYTPRYKRFYYFAENLKEGMNVEITTGPGGRHDFWGLKLGSKTLMTPNEARDARLTDGKWGLGLFVGFLASALWSAKQVPEYRRKGI